MERRRTVSLGFLFCAMMVPYVLHADVLISEIGWVGYQGDANNEWIELWNPSSSSVDVTGFTIVASDGSPTMSLSGSIPAGGYFLLERTDDTSVPGVVADQFFVGALSNAGETLVLKNKSGVSIDTVSGGTEWESIGGDASTGETPQRTSSGWITAPPTPKKGGGTESASTGGVASTKEASSPSSPQTIQMGTLYLDIPYTMTVLAGADTLFSATAYDDKGNESERGTYRWNFGNGVVKHGMRVYYAYSLPGTYVATLSVLDGFSSGDAQIDVTVIAPEVYVGRMTKDAVYIANKSAHDADLSEWKVRQTLPQGGSKELSFPPYTIIRAGHEVPLAHLDTGFVAGVPVTLHYPNGEVVTYAGREASVPYVWTSEQTPISESVPVPSSVRRASVSTEAPVVEEVSSEVLSLPQETPLSLAAVPQSEPVVPLYLILFLCLLVGGGGLLMVIHHYRQTHG